MNGGRRRALVAFGVLILCAILAWVLSELLTSATPAPSGAIAHGPNAGAIGTSDDDRVDVLPNRGQSAKSNDTIEGSDHQEQSTRSTHEPPSKESEPSLSVKEDSREVRVRLVTNHDTPVRNARFRFGVDEGLALRALNADGIVDAQWLTRQAVTDADGWFTVRAPLEGPVWLYLDDPGLVLVDPPEFIPYILPLNGWFVSGHEQRVVLRCDRSRSMVIEMQYEDGQPITGSLVYSIWVGPGNGVGKEVTRMPIVGRSQVTVDRLPPDARIWGHVLSEREGFAMKAVFRHDIREGESFSITVPRSDAQRWGVTVDLSFLKEEEEVTIVLHDRAGMQLGFGAQQVGPGEWRSQNLAPLDEYQVFVVGDEVSWTSGVLRLSETPGEWRRVAVIRQAPATVTFTVVDAEGAPVHPAVALRDPRGYVDWSKPERYAVSSGTRKFPYAVAAGDGRVSYPGLAAGRHQLAIEAQGFARRIVEYSATPGATTELGKIFLDSAQPGREGIVNVRLKGAQNAEQCKVQVFSPGNATVLAPIAFGKDGTAQIRGLNIRAYRIEIWREGSSNRWHKLIDLERQGPVVQVDVEAAELP